MVASLGFGMMLGAYDGASPHQRASSTKLILPAFEFVLIQSSPFKLFFTCPLNLVNDLSAVLRRY